METLKKKIAIVQATCESMEEDGVSELHDNIRENRLDILDLKPVVEAANVLPELVEALQKFNQAKFIYEKHVNATNAMSYLRRFQNAQTNLDAALALAETVVTDGKI